MSGDWRDEYYQMIEDCKQRERHLSSWEIDFLTSISEQLDGKRTLSVKQVEKIEGIWEKATKKG